MPSLEILWPWIAAVLATGLLSGFVSGLLGVGGGIVIVPVLYVMLGLLDVSDDIRMKVAVATSLTTIVATSWSSASSHHKRGGIDFPLLKAWGPWILVGVIGGTALGGYVHAQVLTLVFAVTALLVAINMALRSKSEPLLPDFPNRGVKALSGMFVGSVSAMMGIGGGTLSVPILTAFGHDIRRAVGTASAIGFVIAVPGTIGYAISGFGVAGLPPFSLGFVNLVAFAALVPLSMLTAPLGARVAHTVPKQVLALSFSVFLFATSLRMFWDILG